MILEDISQPAPEPSFLDWNDEGVVKLPGFYNTPAGQRLLNAYCDAWQRDNANRPGGWPYPTPYLDVPEIQALYDPLAPIFEDLLHEPAGLHLNLTGMITTTRNWHQDSYLNPPHVGDYYIAVWIALDDIDPDSGPFQYVPGSHRWPQCTREHILEALGPDHHPHNWPTESERILTPVFEEYMWRMRADVVSYLPKGGDVLLWHGRLCHRGSTANIPGLVRPATIAHLSGINHRSDMPAAVQRPEGGWIFPLTTRQPMPYKREAYP